MNLSEEINLVDPNDGEERWATAVLEGPEGGSLEIGADDDELDGPNWPIHEEPNSIAAKRVYYTNGARRGRSISFFHVANDDKTQPTEKQLQSEFDFSSQHKQSRSLSKFFEMYSSSKSQSHCRNVRNSHMLPDGLAKNLFSQSNLENSAAQALAS